MNTYRIVFAGPVGAGKTTAIGALSDVPRVTTEVARDGAVAAGKETTTVALDYGQVLLDSGDVVQLYGTPGQARFDFMWPIIADSALGAIILTDNSRADGIACTLEYVRAFAPCIVAGSCIVGVGRTETHRTPTLDDYADALAAAGFELPVMAIDARSREHALLLLDVRLARLEATCYVG